MANKKITDLQELLSTDVTSDDVIPVVSDTAGTPTTKKVSVSSLMGQAVSTLDGLTDLTLNANPVDEDVVKYDNGAWVSGQVSVDLTAPLNEALRGTDDVHIGAHPQQSTKVMDSVPEGNAFMVADASGLKFLVKEASASVFVVKGPSASPVRLAEASELPSFSLTKDSGEPDVEITDSDGEVYSVISGDSDSLGSNGLPIRQGYQFPSIGSNPSPLLISGGTIS